MNLVEKSYQIRQDVLDLVYNGKAGHIGGDYSVCDILVTLYYHVMNMSPEKVNDPNRDRFILSKGHSVESLYCILADQGYFPKEDLKTYSQFGSKYIGHPNNKINGIEMNSGSLGHGLPVAVGMALAGKMDQAPYRVYTVMGDGELAEGSVWEGAMAASHYKLDNLTAVVDRNRLQISGSTEVVMHHEDLGKRFESFGWHVIHASGNDISALIEAFEEAKATKGVPTMIIADTVKGCGVSFMENQAVWHHKVPTEVEYIQAKEELKEKEAQARE
ncbi:MAG TPA: transketolase [Candidatus Faecimorpha stercoravium]|nr:transketolase [Candidatus Faecimorpha stercoravium]